jgi:hypothetical protein
VRPLRCLAAGGRAQRTSWGPQYRATRRHSGQSEWITAKRRGGTLEAGRCYSHRPDSLLLGEDACLPPNVSVETQPTPLLRAGLVVVLEPKNAYTSPRDLRSSGQQQARQGELLYSWSIPMKRDPLYSSIVAALDILDDDQAFEAAVCVLLQRSGAFPDLVPVPGGRTTELMGCLEVTASSSSQRVPTLSPT